MKRNYLIGIAVTAAALGLLALAAWALFGIEPITEWVPPSREARMNEYLALDRWLESGGIPVRTEKSADMKLISQAEEQRIFMQSSLFRWNDEAAEYLTRWIEEGGSLFLVLELNRWDNDEPLLFLEEFGITAETDPAETGAASLGRRYDSESPSFDRGLSFDLREDMDAVIIRDWSGFIKLVQVRRGKGMLTVTGRPRFLLSSYLDRAPNARLAWILFTAGFKEPADSEDSGWLFIRGATKVQGLFGALFRQGNLIVLLAALTVLLVISFWAILPMFGLVKSDDRKPGKPLRERFLAEGRFLKSYHALEIYRRTYIAEIKRNLARKEGVTGTEETEQRLLEILGRPGDNHDSVLLHRVLHDEPVAYREFPKMIGIFKTILERM